MNYLILFLIDGSVSIIAENIGYPMVTYISKVLLMPFLALYLYHQTKEIKKYSFIYLALFFSWWGDIFLMFPRAGESTEASKNLFLAGLISFLIGHINYIIYFLKEIKQSNKTVIMKQQPYWMLPFLLYIFALLSLLFPSLSVMKIPVTVYSTVILMMAITAFNRKNIANGLSFKLTFIGAVLFVVSDSCIAINVFYQHYSFAGIVIMTTYLAAQLLIVKGILAQRGNV